MLMVWICYLGQFGWQSPRPNRVTEEPHPRFLDLST
jgi:hypothetical protein